ncbi:MAG TPA: DUF5103 domain-containing protein, partial [Bacteroidia bacterium]|nr:DUF5103 domain-containing protein [Bacteroidia bacterium]
MNIFLKKTSTFLFFLLLMLCHRTGYSFPDVISDTILDNQLQTILFYQSGKINSYPFIDINKPDMSLTLAFDDMSGGYKSFEYQIVYCNFDWTVSELFPDQYLTGP